MRRGRLATWRSNSAENLDTIKLLLLIGLDSEGLCFAKGVDLSLEDLDLLISVADFRTGGVVLGLLGTLRLDVESKDTLIGTFEIVGRGRFVGLLLLDPLSDIPVVDAVAHGDARDVSR